MALNPDLTLVQASRPHPDPDATWELTGIDRANHFLVLRGTWLFEGGLEPEQLVQGLARLLCHYPHLAGRMREGKRVLLDNSGVPFTHVAMPQLTLALVEGDHRIASQFHPGWRQGRVKKGLDAPMAVGLTDLADGQVLSVTCTHACMDGNSFYTLVHNWGRLCRGLDIEPPVLDQALLPLPEPRSKAQAAQAAKDAGWTKLPLIRGLPTLVRLAFGGLTNRSRPIHLDDAALDRLRQAAGGGELSVNDVISAHLARMCARLYDHGADTLCKQVVVLDGRRRLPGIPPSFVGNASVNVIGATFPGDVSLPTLAQQTHEVLGPWLSKPSAAMDTHMKLARELMQHGVLKMHFDITAMHGARPTISYINNFSRLPIYDACFGTAQQPIAPARVIPHDLPDPLLLWPSPPGQGGLELYLTGSPDHASRALPADHPWWAELLLEQA